MKNLVPLYGKISYWDKIVNGKHGVSRAHLQAIRPQVLNRFSVYSRHIRSNNLEIISVSPFVLLDMDLLQGCYSNSKNLSVLKTKILDRQEGILQGECQYCNIGPPNTFDHYLSQSLFPEFSALSINLFPCCPTCNNKKGEEWLLHGNRMFINFYYDTLPNVVYLNCNILFRNNVPKAEFTLNSAIIPARMRTIIDNHFSHLELTDKYKKRSNSEISDVIDAISPYVGVLTRFQIIANLLNEASNMQARRGVNYWRAILRIALANSNRFLRQVGF